MGLPKGGEEGARHDGNSVLGGKSVKWRENTSRPGEVERAGMDATEYIRTGRSKPTRRYERWRAVITIAARPRRAITITNSRRLFPSPIPALPLSTPAHTYNRARNVRVYYVAVARARGDSSLPRVLQPSPACTTSASAKIFHQDKRTRSIPTKFYRRLAGFITLLAVGLMEGIREEIDKTTLDRRNSSQVTSVVETKFII